MFKLVVGLFCLLWILCGMVVFFIGFWRRTASRRKDGVVEKDVHDGSSIITGAVIALALGPISLMFALIDWWKNEE